MNTLLDDDNDASRHNDRELTLSTGTILGIFLALVLLCGAFFGFGYKIGSHKAAQPDLSSAADTTAEPNSNFTDFKPAAGSPENGSDAVSAPTKLTAAERKEARADEASGKPAVSASEARLTRAHNEAASHAAAEPPSTPTAEPVPAPAGTYFVQVAAVSHEEDAQLLIRALKAKGYPVGAHTQPQDKFYHVQVGPFENRKDADAAKQRLVADGYQPIIK